MKDCGHGCNGYFCLIDILHAVLVPKCGPCGVQYPTVTLCWNPLDIQHDWEILWLWDGRRCEEDTSCWTQEVILRSPLNTSLSLYCQSQYQSLPAHKVSCDLGFNYECYLWLPLLFRGSPHIPACHHSCVTWCIVSLFSPLSKLIAVLSLPEIKKKKKKPAENIIV